MTLYKPFMEFKYGATFGKMAIKVKVVNKDLGKITLSQAILRNIIWIPGQILSIYATILLFQHPDFISATGFTEIGSLQNEVTSSSLTMGNSIFGMIACIIVAFTVKKQGLHDIIASTYCMYTKS